jgi:hypothetical protein
VIGIKSESPKYWSVGEENSVDSFL